MRGTHYQLGTFLYHTYAQLGQKPKGPDHVEF